MDAVISLLLQSRKFW